ncbi:MAG: hypothetical protein JHC31_12370 [Sulfurihydrogenibium sp.]|jgi:hypothetical protein|nr:hypothetical protein [Sulfurihydrogenibium sp.]
MPDTVKAKEENKEALDKLIVSNSVYNKCSCYSYVDNIILHDQLHEILITA